MPLVLAAAFDAGDFFDDRHRLRLAVMDVWHMAEHPVGEDMPEDVWLAMFDAAGFVTDCRRCRRPRTPHRLWRGCLPGHEYGMSWTDSLEKAQWFADRPQHQGYGQVFEVVAPADAVLARIRHGRNESEWVLDPRIIRGLPVQLLGLTCGYMDLTDASRATWGMLPESASATYPDVYQFLLRQGVTEWTPAPRPKAVRKRKDGASFLDAVMVASARPDLRYCEGLAWIGRHWNHHAWCVTEGGVVVDSTWDVPGLRYLGITLPVQEVCGLLYSHGRTAGGIISAMEPNIRVRPEWCPHVASDLRPAQPD